MPSKPAADVDSLLEWLTPNLAGDFLRFGGSGDGAYLVPKDLDGVSGCFSPGVANRKDFEDELLSKENIRSHLMDASSDESKFRTPLVSPQQTFLKKWLKPEDSEDSVSLNSWVNEMAPDNTDLVLQMDIEGAEYPNLSSASRATLSRFRVMVIEFHGLGQMTNPEKFMKEKGPAFAALQKDHSVVHLHPNNCCGTTKVGSTGAQIPNVLEVTLLRNDRLHSWSKAGSTFVSPHPLDIGWNVLRNRPLFLGPEFLSEESVGESLLRQSAINSLWFAENQRNEALELCQRAGWMGR